MSLVEGYPALMSTEMAARYLFVEESKFIDLASFSKTPAVEVRVLFLAPFFTKY